MTDEMMNLRALLEKSPQVPAGPPGRGGWSPGHVAG
jgi:hypothetical protein